MWALQTPQGFAAAAPTNFERKEGTVLGDFRAAVAIVTLLPVSVLYVTSSTSAGGAKRAVEDRHELNLIGERSTDVDSVMLLPASVL
mgnify:CR=1 FL=1